MKLRLFSLVILVLLICVAPLLATDDEVQITGPPQSGLEPFDKLMTTFLANHQIPGASLAVTRNGRLVYARGFGWADRKAREPVTPSSLFRLASISKPITSAAIFKLIELGKLKLDDHPFELLKLDPIPQSGFTPDPRLKDITVLELLQHRGGFDRDVSPDPMFECVPFARLAGHAPPATAIDIIRVMEGRPLDFAPGERYAYSNFGYCVLGRLIEHVSGDSYEAFVQKTVLNPLRIEHMQLGHTLLSERAKGEVYYYSGRGIVGQSIFPQSPGQVASPYGFWSVEAMDSHGGWIASAPDLVRFASALDDPAASGILTPADIAETFSRPPGAAGRQGHKPDGRPAAAWYGCGWFVRDVGSGRINTWHTGLLDGTSTLVVRRWDGLDWAVLFNQDRDGKGAVLSDLIDPLVHQTADSVTRWPQGVSRDNVWP
jgi:N-acyl-D-amino-acid deacylase